MVFWGLLAATLLGQSVEIQPATPVSMSAYADGNSPSFWREGRFHLYNSTGSPYVLTGLDQFTLASFEAVGMDRYDSYPMWIESAWVDTDGTVYAWYHHEPLIVCPNNGLTYPSIGALVSMDGGRSFRDLGIVLEAPDTPNCNARNEFFAGGHGDFSVVLDRERQYFYFLFGNYGGPATRQGISLARMAFDDRASPKGKVWKYANGGWEQKGVGGNVTPVYPAASAWGNANTDSFWGPAVHYNHYLDKYVILMNRSCCSPGWPQEGIYLALASDLSDPSGYTVPVKLPLDNLPVQPAYYPQVIGLGEGETDTFAGRVARLYVKGESRWEIVFGPPPAPEPAPEPTPN